jgi:hypothetical protein
MKPFRKNIAIAIDGGGIRGVIPARALMMLEEALGKTCHEIFRLAVGTSTLPSKCIVSTWSLGVISSKRHSDRAFGFPLISVIRAHPWRRLFARV